MNYRSKKYSLTSNRSKKRLFPTDFLNFLTCWPRLEKIKTIASRPTTLSNRTCRFLKSFKYFPYNFPRYKQTQQTDSIYAVDRYNPTSRVLAVNKFKRLVLNLVYKRANTYIYICIYSTRCLRFPISLVEDNGERTRMEEVTTPPVR